MTDSQEIVPHPPRLPPQALEAEQSLLGALLLDSLKWDEVVDLVTAQDFYNRNHKIIFATIFALQHAREAVDVITVSEKLEADKKLENVGGLAYIGGLANNTPGSANILTYAKIVRERSILRSLIAAANDISNAAYNPEGRTPSEVLDNAEKQVFEISEKDGRNRRRFRQISEILPHTMDRIDELYQSKEGITGIPTGFTDIDKVTSGMQRGDLVVVAGRPSMGKTAFAMNVAVYVALEKNIPVGVFSLEMSGEQLAMRLLASLGQINSNQVRTGRISEKDWPRLNSAIGLLDKSPIYVDESSGLNVIELRSTVRKMMAESDGELGLIIVDYLQLMQSNEINENRATEISGITRAIKLLAKELNIPIMVLSQLNRSLESRQSKRPVLSDLRESGAIEQDADLIMFIYRDEVYNENSDQQGIAEIIIGKQRNGPIGIEKLSFKGEYTLFENYSAAF